MKWLSRLTALTQLPLFAADDQPDAMVVRVSARARRMSLRVFPAGRVEVVVPPATPAPLIREFVARNRGWLDERLRECSARQAALVVPNELLLAALERRIEITTRSEPGVGNVRVRSLGTHSMVMRGELSDPKRWSPALLRSLVSLAQAEFEPRLRALALQHGFEFERMQVRRQRTRWGSCSSRGSISLNVCALFLRPDVLRYLMIHELCHTKHMNHSTRFWALVEKCEPQWRELDSELNRAWKHVPAWVFVTGSDGSGPNRSGPDRSGQNRP